MGPGLLRVGLAKKRYYMPLRLDIALPVSLPFADVPFIGVPFCLLWTLTLPASCGILC